MYDNKQLYYPNQPQQVTAVQPGILIAEPAPYQQQQYYNNYPPQNPYMNQPPNYFQPGPVMMPTTEAQCTGQTSSIVVMCPHCQRRQQTRVKCSVGTKLWMCCMIWTMPILFGLPPCCCFPFLIPSCYEYKHYCTSCDMYLGASMTGGSMGF